MVTLRVRQVLQTSRDKRRGGRCKVHLCPCGGACGACGFTPGGGRGALQPRGSHGPLSCDAGRGWSYILRLRSPYRSNKKWDEWLLEPIVCVTSVLEMFRGVREMAGTADTLYFLCIIALGWKLCFSVFYFCNSRRRTECLRSAAHSELSSCKQD